MERMERILLVLLVLSECLVLLTCLQRQYHIINRNLSWIEAHTYCRHHYTDLVTMANDTDRKALLEILTSSGHNYSFWIGLHTEINWRWSDGYTGNGADYRNFRSGYPDYYENQFCIYFLRFQGWDDFDCSIKMSFICKKVSDSEFVFVNESMDWSSAQTYCRKNHRDLATVKSGSENIKVSELVPSKTTAWIGLFRDPNLYWSDGRNFSYNKIVYPNPTNSLKVMCGFTSLKLSGGWKFVSCENKFPFICFGTARSDSFPVNKIVKLRLKTKNSVDLNNPAVKEDLLKELQDRLKKNGVTGVSLKWREQPDGRVFRKKKKREKTEL